MDNNPWGVILGLVLFILFMFGMFWLARIVFRLLLLLSPLLVIAAVILDAKVIVGYFRWLFGLVKRNTPLGIIAIVLSVLGFPLVSAYWFFRALMNFQVRRARKQKGEDTLELGEYIDYEEIKRKEKLREEKGNDPYQDMV